MLDAPLVDAVILQLREQDVDLRHCFDETPLADLKRTETRQTRIRHASDTQNANKYANKYCVGVKSPVQFHLLTLFLSDWLVEPLSSDTVFKKPR